MKFNKSMVEYVKLQKRPIPSSDLNEADYYYQEYEVLEKICKYANFLSQKLELWMFVACDENGNVLNQPLNYGAWVRKDLNVSYDLDLSKYEQFKTALSKTIFEGFEWNTAEFCDEPMLELEDKNGNYLLYDCEDKNFQDSSDNFISKVEQLIPYNLDIKESVAKELGLI